MKKIALSPRGKLLLQRFALGGAALGGGVASAAALANYLKYLGERAGVGKGSDEDDDTLYVDIPAPAPADGTKTAAEDRSAKWWEPGAAIAAGGMGTLLSFALIDKLYKKQKKKRLQEDLDAAQQVYLGELSKSASGQAPDQFRFYDIMTGAPVSLALLTALAGGAVSYNAMDKAFPKPKRPKNQGPRRVKIRRVPLKENPIEVEEDAEEKKAFHIDSEASQAADEMLLKMALAATSPGDAWLHDLVGAVASGRHSELRAHVLDGGWETVPELVKGAAAYDVDPEQRQLAISLLTAGPLGPVVKLAAAAEFANAFPLAYTSAASHDTGIRDALAGIASCVGALERQEKMASVLSAVESDDAGSVGDAGLVAMLEQLVAQGRQSGNESLEIGEAGARNQNRNDTVAGSATPNSTARGEAEEGAQESDAKDPVDGLFEDLRKR